MNQFDRRSFLATTAGAALATALPALAQTSRVNPFPAGSEDHKLRAMLDQMFEAQVDESPRRATGLGLDKGARAALKSQLDDNSAAGRAKRLARTRTRVAELHTIDRAKLNAASRIDLDVVLYGQEETVKYSDKWKFGDVGGNFRPYVISQQTGSYQEIPDFLDNAHKVANSTDAEAYLSRLSAFAHVMDNDLERQRHDVALGAIPATFVCDLSIGQMKALRDQPAARTVMVTSLIKKAKAAGVLGDWEGRASKIVEAEVFPALDRQIAAMAALKAKTKPDNAAWALPNGEAYYADAVKASTTTDYTPEQVHQLGRDQVAEISGRLDAILKKQGLTQGTVGARLVTLNNRPDQVFADSDAGRAEILKLLNDHITFVYTLLPKAFDTLPKAKVEVRRVPVFIQDGAANGYYNSAPLDGSRPAIFNINLKDVSDWPRYNLWTLAHHETIPGHHLQIALSQESTVMPIIRRAGGGYSAFVEGWALYAEQLAQELGANDFDPLGEAGYLQSLLFRAARLVTDTGIHAKRWTRAQATQYMVDTIGNTKTRAQREVERYFVSPGQANSYKVGHTVWVKVRDEAKAKLGPKFNLKAYHDAVLLSGAMPLTVLQRHVAEWLATQA
ncbi:MAG TPA: DUF885 family protein [Phenylobacterium sp.]|jgi:uncharacterized protein (DUF885 family)|uniref:DUF885 domain-containing protein n=1 Tax=Phenylobacterium sp. TaxID=1871053 RepID=UPI002D36D854|nr:DUF885 family protein [Phenylobacterium sp.]HZZ67044.1 DUF885 family protein [Phenylobacterium sp.]